MRTTDAELLPVFGAPALVFSGGAGGPVDALAATPVVPVSEDGGAPGFFRSGAARAPYNLHTNLQDGRRATVSGISQPNNPGFVFAATDPRVDAGPSATSLAVQYQAARVEFAFEDGRYRLVRNGDPQIDARARRSSRTTCCSRTSTSSRTATVDSVGSPSFISHTVGTGTFTLFRDGHAIVRDLEPAGADQPTQYLDAAGAAGAVQAGQDLGCAGAAERVGGRVLTHRGRASAVVHAGFRPGRRVEFGPNQADATVGDRSPVAERSARDPS